MATNKISLNIFQSCLENKNFKMVFHFDRLKLYIDSSNKNIKIRKACANEDQLKIIPRGLLNYPYVDRMLDAHQPDNRILKRLEKALDGDYVITYAEFAMDILCDSTEQVEQLSGLLASLLTFERNSSEYRFYHNQFENTHYFGKRHTHKDILVIYSDKKSKTDGTSHCVHLEIRLSGSKILKDWGFYKLQDLIDFQHETIWDKYLDLRDVNYTELGSLDPEAKPNLTDSSLRRRGQKLFDGYGGVQALLMDNPDWAQAFAPITNRRMFELRLDKALGNK